MKLHLLALLAVSSVLWFGTGNSTHAATVFSAQTPPPIVEQGGPMNELTIQSSVRCGMCQATIQEVLKPLKGVKLIKVDLAKQQIVIRYKNGKADVNEIRQAIARAGYDADDVKADASAYEGLPECCKKPGSH
jgi:copper chaperone CopZ